MFAFAAGRPRFFPPPAAGFEEGLLMRGAPRPEEACDVEAAPPRPAGCGASTPAAFPAAVLSAARENSSPCGLALGALWCWCGAGAGAAAAAFSSPAARAWTENTGALPLAVAVKRPPPAAFAFAAAAVGIFSDVTPFSALPCASPPSGAALDALSHAGVPPKSDFFRL